MKKNIAIPGAIANASKPNVISFCFGIFSDRKFTLILVIGKKTIMAKVIIEKLSEKEIDNRKIKSWPIWTKEISEFDWSYDSDEECLILEGEVTVKTSEGNYSVKAGDFVTFRQGLKCIWDVKKPIRKHYNFK